MNFIPYAYVYIYIHSQRCYTHSINANGDGHIIAWFDKCPCTRPSDKSSLTHNYSLVVSIQTIVCDSYMKTHGIEVISGSACENYLQAFGDLHVRDSIVSMVIDYCSVRGAPNIKIIILKDQENQMAHANDTD